MMSNPNFGVWRPMAESIEFNALESNSNAVMAVADTVRTTLGPKGLDKLLIDQAMNRHVSNDGVTILLSLRAIHPVETGTASRRRYYNSCCYGCGNDQGRKETCKGAWRTSNQSC
jgi:hypothetical protein